MSNHHWSVTDEKLPKKICNGCMDDATDLSIRVSSTGCYHSTFPTDCTRIEFDLCEACQAALCANLKWGIDEYDYLIGDGTETPVERGKGNSYMRLVEVRAGRLLFDFQDSHQRWFDRVKRSPFYRRGSMKRVERALSIRVAVQKVEQWYAVKQAAPWLDEETCDELTGYVWRRDGYTWKGKYGAPPKVTGPSLEAQMRALKKLPFVQTWWCLREEADERIGLHMDSFFPKNCSPQEYGLDAPEVVSSGE